MAGIGFELKKLFGKKGLFAMVKAYGYAGVVCAGPMILGMVLLFGVRIFAGMGGLEKNEQDLLICMITYTLLFSLAAVNILSLISTRFIADIIYLDRKERLMGSFYGSISLLLIGGSLIYGLFLVFSGVPFSYRICCLWLFNELVVVWSQISYMTAIKDYKGILLNFLLAILSAMAVAVVCMLFNVISVLSMMLAVIIGYGIMMVSFFVMMLEFFPKSRGSSMYFLEWLDLYPQLVWVGLFIGTGLFGHLVIMWFGPLGVQVQGLFYGAPGYDVPSLLAFLSILITTVNFVTSVEVNFYPKYKIYFDLYNNGGTLEDIELAESEMKDVLARELGYVFVKQFFATVVFIIGGTLFIPQLPLGFTEEMLGVFRVLCVGYAFYAVGNCVMLISLYFSDNTGAFLDTFFYAVSCVSLTIISLWWNPKYFGFGFLIAGFIFALVSIMRLSVYMKDLGYYIISRQPFVLNDKKGFAALLSKKMEERYIEKSDKN